MGILSVLQWPLSFYTGGLTGLQQQPIVNAIRFLITVIANVGAAIVLYWFSRTIVAFFAWQIVVNALYVLILTALLWRRLSGVNPSEFRLSVLRDVWRFAIGMTGIGASALLLTQLDKIILVKILPLREFGYYVLATTLSAGLYLIISSIFNGIFPRFATLAARGEEEKLRILYREATQLMAVAILPLAAVMALHAHTIVLAWTGDTVAAAKAAPIIAILVLGTALNGLMNLPYALQLAYGWTRLGLSINLALVILLVPAILFVAPRYGAVGGASVWLVLNLIYMAIAVPMTHRRLLRGETFRWFCRDIIPVALGAFATSSVIRIFSPLSPSRGEAFAFAALAVVASFLGGMCFSPIARRWLV
jgi:O-antigen/teichoic acid export membrane protein